LVIKIFTLFFYCATLYVMQHCIAKAFVFVCPPVCLSNACIVLYHMKERLS